MSTSAVFLRAASFVISTAQPLKTGLRRSFTAIAECSLRLQSKGRSSVTFANRGQQDGSHTHMVPSSHNIFARPVHTSAVCRANCDWGRPCDCRECREASREHICEICKVNPTAYKFDYVDHDSPSGFSYTTYCEECAEKSWEEERRRKEAEAKIAAAHQEIAAAQQDKVNKMLEHVKSLPPGEQVPIAYAIDKISSIWRSGTSAARRHRALRQILSEELQIVKVGRRWKCDKGRVDAMDFDLWRSRSYTPRSKQYPLALTMWTDD